MRRNSTIFKIITVTIAIKCLGHCSAFLPTCIPSHAAAGANLSNWCWLFLSHIVSSHSLLARRFGLYFSNERPTVIILLQDLGRKHPDEVTMTAGSSPWGLKADMAAWRLRTGVKISSWRLLLVILTCCYTSDSMQQVLFKMHHI